MAGINFGSGRLETTQLMGDENGNGRLMKELERYAAQ
jgi:hypothetical protein